MSHLGELSERDAIALAKSLRHYYGAHIQEVAALRTPTPTTMVVLAWPASPAKPVLCVLDSVPQVARFLGVLFRFYGPPSDAPLPVALRVGRAGESESVDDALPTTPGDLHPGDLHGDAQPLSAQPLSGVPDAAPAPEPARDAV